MTNWDEVIREMYGEVAFGSQINKPIPGTDEFLKLVKSDGDMYHRMSMVYNLVKSSMIWNGEKNKRSNSVKEAWSKKFGSSGDMNLILINLLQDAGVEVYPVLASERSNGLINKNLPFVEQFNIVLAMVKIGEKTYFLDATERYCPPNIIPAPVLNTQALLMERRGGGIIQIKDEALSFKQTLTITMKFSAHNTFTGKMLASGFDYARVDMIKELKNDRTRFMEHHFSLNNPGLRIDSFDTKNEDNDSLPFQAAFKYELPPNQSGDYTFIPLNLFNEYQVNPFTSERRLSNINFGYKSVSTCMYYIDLPEGYVVDALPKSLLLKTPDKTISVSREIFSDEVNNKLVAKIRIENTVSWLPVDEYQSVRQFFKMMNDLLNEQVVLRKVKP